MGNVLGQDYITSDRGEYTHVLYKELVLQRSNVPAKLGWAEV